uniref:Aspartic proteinase Asp1 n=2 Tax=Oryza meridionalis TaxID=40149 RepID=A0A0E0F344_9ORYZ
MARKRHPPSAEEVVGAAARREEEQATGSYLAPPLCIGTDIIGCNSGTFRLSQHLCLELHLHHTMAARLAVLASLLLLLQLVPPSSAVVLELHGKVYPTGHFFVTMNIGDPAKPYFLDIDTGSTLTWLQCDAPCTNCNIVPHVLYKPTPKKLVTCADSLCTDLYTDLGKPKRCGSQKQCDYVIRYVDSSSMGVLVIDRFSLSARNGTSPTTIAFGCGYDQGKKNRNVPVPVDGILGLGRGKVTLLSQLKSQGVITKHVLGHCISSKGGGFLFFGDAQVPTSGVTWTPMNREHKYYSPGHGTLHFDSNSKAISAAPMAVIFDSGATYTYFAAQPYQATLSVVKSTLSNECKFLTEVTEKDRALTVCWKGKDKIITINEVKKCFRSLSLKFADGDKKATLEIPPEHYLIISQEGHVCLGILDGSKEHPSLAGTNLIGGITMLDQMVIYDSERSLLGWVNYQCDIIPRSESAITSRL